MAGRGWIHPIFATAVFVASVGALSAADRPRSPAAELSFVNVTSEDETGLSIEVRIPDSATKIEFDEAGRRKLSIGRLPKTVTPGAPELPVIVTAIGIPDGKRLRLSRSSAPEEALDGSRIRSVPRVDAETGLPLVGLDPALLRGKPWPQDNVVVEEAQFRELRMARLLIHPARYDPSTEELLLTRAIDIRVDFVEDDSVKRRGTSLDRLAKGIAERRLLNRRTLISDSPAPSVDPLPGVVDLQWNGPAPAAAPSAINNPGVKILVDTEGLIRITRSELTALGFDPAPVDPRNLEISYRGDPVPCRVVGESDGSFDPGDVIEFYGRPFKTRFTEESVYWLEEQATTGLRFPTRDATPGTAALAADFPNTEHYEDNTLWTRGKPAAEGDPHFFWVWFEDNPNPPRVTTFTHAATLPGFDAASPEDGTFRAFFAGRTDTGADPDHHVRLFVNGTQIGDATWNGQTFLTVDLPFSSSLLNTGSNDFRVDFVNITFPDIYYLDWIDIVYPRQLSASAGRLFVSGDGAGPTRYRVDGLSASTDGLILDVSNPLAPLELTGVDVSGTEFELEETDPTHKRYLFVDDTGRTSAAGLTLDIPSTLQDGSNGADLIIVVPEGWESALQPLVAHRQAQGLRVVLTNLTDVGDEFQGGHSDDEAIRDLVQYAYENWQPPTVGHLVLVGEPNVDPLDYLGSSPFHHYMPTHMGVTVSHGETTSDTWFGAVAGGDFLPDVAVSRISVRTPAEAGNVAAKIIGYENNPPNGAAWGRTVLQVASNESQFETALEGAAASLPQHFTVDPEYRNSGANATSIRNAFNAGAVMASFLGHGNVTFWADLVGGPFYDDSDVTSLSNSGKLPFVTAMNCLNGSIALPTTIDSLAEIFNNLTSTGALAVWSPSAVGFFSPYDSLQRELYATIFEDHVPYVGSATTVTLVETFLTQPISIDIVKEMVLLGDSSGWLAIDSDDDALLDRDELVAGLDPADRDSDDDGLLDGLEGIITADADGDGVPNALDPDADNDGLPDGLEAGVDTADSDTDVSKGFFRADSDTGSTTDPFDADTDAGGAPDGVEDLDVDGMVDGGEFDPQVGADDPACTAGTPVEIGAVQADQLRLAKSGSDITLTWGDASASDPCILYFVYSATDLDNSTEKAGFTLLGVTATPSFTHVGAVSPSNSRRYVVSASSLSGGEGPWGHYGN